MALIKCSECGNMVSDTADRCPNCGAAVNQSNYQNQNYPQEQEYYQPPKKSNTLLYVIIGILSTALVAGLIFLIVNQIQKNDKANDETKKEMEALKKQNEDLQGEVDDAKKQAAEAKEAKQQEKVIVKQGAVHAAEHRSVSAGTAGRTPYVVVNGTKVRLRFAPSLNAGFLTWPNGTIRSVPKYTRLQYGGWEDGDWYRVIYQGVQFYISKEFSYLEYN